jgi:hypothetical protein
MKEKHVLLYDRLPEIYKIRDEEQQPPGQLKNYLKVMEDVFEAIHEDIESLYDDLFIETCNDWAIPYIADLLGTSHLKGVPWTQRAEVADTIALRRRKGTLGAIEQLTYDLTQWGVHCVELRENMVWNQHLNHQRPDRGGEPPYSNSTMKTVIRGGTVTLRDPATLSLLNTPFDQFAHIADLKAPVTGCIRYNIPDLAIFLWRLKAYRVTVSKPGHPVPAELIIKGNMVPGDEAKYIARFDVHPLDEPVRLFNTHRLNQEKNKPILNQIRELTEIDETPGPIIAARLNCPPADTSGNYVEIDIYSGYEPIDISDVGLQLHMPLTPDFSKEKWLIRGANLCAWEESLNPPLKNREIAIDPVIGRIVIGVDTSLKGDTLIKYLLLTYTYGAVGPVGAHPVSRSLTQEKWDDEDVVRRDVNFNADPDGLKIALMDIQDKVIAIEINDSMTHELDLKGYHEENGEPNLQMNKSLIIRAASGQRPIIKLAQPLRFRKTNIADAAKITVRLEGLYLTRKNANDPLIARAAIDRLEIIGCTLDPGGSKKLDVTPEGKAVPSMKLQDSNVLNTDVVVERSIVGPLFIDTGYNLNINDSIIDAKSGVNDDPDAAYLAVAGAAGDKDSWGPITEVKGITVFGRMRVESISGAGGIWVHALEVLEHQSGCIKFSYFSGKGDRLPQHHGCVFGTEAHLGFTSETFGHPAYGQLAQTSDFRVRERGQNDDAMGAFGFMLEAHKWRNIQIRYREFMPAGMRFLMIPVT